MATMIRCQITFIARKKTRWMTRRLGTIVSLCMALARESYIVWGWMEAMKKICVAASCATFM